MKRTRYQIGRCRQIITHRVLYTQCSEATSVQARPDRADDKTFLLTLYFSGDRRSRVECASVASKGASSTSEGASSTSEVASSTSEDASSTSEGIYLISFETPIRL